MAAHCAQTEHRFVCPQLPASPASAMALACEFVEDRGDPARDWAVIGSSLGGFYATHLAERYGCRAALLNPAVRPEADLGAHVGVLTAFHGDEPFEFKPEYLDELAALRVERITRPERYFLLVRTGDEVLDWREAVACYGGAAQYVLGGGDHGWVDFDDEVPSVLKFADGSA